MRPRALCGPQPSYSGNKRFLIVCVGKLFNCVRCFCRYTWRSLPLQHEHGGRHTLSVVCSSILLATHSKMRYLRCVSVTATLTTHTHTHTHTPITHEFQEKSVRVLASALLRDMLFKHDYDSRYQVHRP